MSSPLIELIDIELCYKNEKIFSGLHFSLFEHEKITFLGPSGSGKTSLLKILAGLLVPQKGHLHSSLSAEQKGIIFQEPRLLPWLTVEQNLLVPYKILNLKSHEKYNVTWFLKNLDLYQYRSFYPHQISGGMKQRAALGRALMTLPRVLLLDEPFSALDEVIKVEMKKLMLQMQREFKFAFVMVTHSIQDALEMSDKTYVVQKNSNGFSYIGDGDERKADILMTYLQKRHKA